jgi:hypothetical protein
LSGNEIIDIQNFSVNSNLDLPLFYQIPSLGQGEYQLKLLASDSQGHENEFSLGAIVISSQPQSSGGGGSHRSSNTGSGTLVLNKSLNASDNKSTNATNLTDNFNATNTNNSGYAPRTVSPITGAIIGAVSNPKILGTVLFIAIIIVLYFFIKKKVRFT